MSTVDYFSNLQALWKEGEQRFINIFAGLSESQANLKPLKGSWSIAQCLHHVNRSNEGYLPLMNNAVEEGSERGEPPFHYGRLSRWFLRSVGPEGRRLKTIRQLEPPKATSQSELDMERLLEQLDTDVGRMIELIEESRGLDLGRIRIPSPFVPLIRLPLGIAFEAMAQHTIRHAIQAERIREHPGFSS